MSSATLLETPPWPAILAKVPASARCVFTYADLGQDLTGSPSRERGQLWRRLIGLLGMPPGSVAFLPYRLPGSDDPRTAQTAFTHALRRIAPASVLAFTSSDSGLLQELLSRAGQGDSRSMRLFTAPDPHVLLTSSDDSLLSNVPPSAKLLRFQE
ncbi:hypothetical protein NNJEOMEG_03228 [Fundidesulfovibrio magnetotacticus]|uniref:Uncharacterized protein n=1 Tax=Fundidesulfovibrio magnetotacticus TaxID=2730080 RepID=A0A6V8M006_9BACT|nr:hypothetical protein NNJEOMEG_03228 [Fundidesulfovibrio magnetotacticus]